MYCFLSLQALPRSAPSGRTGPHGLPAHPNADRGGGGDATREEEEEEETTKAVEEGDASGPIRKTGTARGDSASRVSHIDTIKLNKNSVFVSRSSSFPFPTCLFFFP